jgi:hypothetical protein
LNCNSSSAGVSIGGDQSLTDMVRVIEDWEVERAVKPGDRLVG